MQVIYFGSGAFGLPTLEALRGQHEMVAAVTQPDRPSGRSRRLASTAVADWAQQHEVNVLKSGDVNDPAFIRQIEQLKPEAAVVIAFGQKLSPALIGALGRLAINLHASLLPKYRGAAPINWAMIRNEQVTGVSVIGLAERMDAGLIYASAELPIQTDQTAGELHDQLAALGPHVVEQVLADLASGSLRGRPQDEALATRAPKLAKRDGTVDFNQPAELVRARIHGLTPWPSARVNWTCRSTGRTGPLTLRRARDHPVPPDFIQQHLESGPVAPGTILDGYHVVSGRGTVKLLEVQSPGTRVMPTETFARGHQIGPGDTLEPIKE